MSDGKVADKRGASLAGRSVQSGGQRWRAIGEGLELPPLAGRASGQLLYQPDWLPVAEADRLLGVLQGDLPWRNHPVRIYGRELPSPRLSSWHGDPDASYRYSGMHHSPQPWTAVLSRLRQRLATDGLHFNSVLANLYRDGNDAMGWHADDEPELGEQPLIASISLGAARRFVLRPHPRRSPATERGLRRELVLTHGSLLLMAGSTQQHWQHALPRMRGVDSPRINLTFRWVQQPR